MILCTIDRTKIVYAVFNCGLCRVLNFHTQATARLVDTISCWIRNDELAKDAKEDLLADALKMPFTVFGKY